MQLAVSVIATVVAAIVVPMGTPCAIVMGLRDVFLVFIARRSIVTLALIATGLSGIVRSGNIASIRAPL